MHFAMLVIGEDTFYSLDKYNEQNPTILPKEEAIENLKEWILLNLKPAYDNFMLDRSEKNGAELEYLLCTALSSRDKIGDLEKAYKELNSKTDDELFEVIKNDTNVDISDDDKVIYPYNLNGGYYDWCVLGGRWQGMLKLKRGSKSGIVGSLSTFGGEHKNGRFDAALFGDIDWDSEAMNDFYLYGWVDDYGWRDRDTENLYGEENLDEWRKLFKDRMASIKDDEMVYVVDFHV